MKWPLGNSGTTVSLQCTQPPRKLLDLFLIRYFKTTKPITFDLSSCSHYDWRHTFPIFKTCLHHVTRYGCIVLHNIWIHVYMMFEDIFVPSSKTCMHLYIMFGNIYTYRAVKYGQWGEPPIKAWPPQPLLYTRKVKTLNTMVHFLVTFILTKWLQQKIRDLSKWEVPVLAPFKVDSPLYN